MNLKITFLAVFIAHLLCLQIVAQNNNETNERFAFVLTKKGSNQLILESIYGTSWELMSSNMLPVLESNNKRYIYNSGISNDTKGISENSFLVEVIFNRKQIILKSLNVAEWKEMSFLCMEKECSFLITERSITEIDELSPSIKAQMMKTYEALASDKSKDEYDSAINQIATDEKIAELQKRRDEIEREEKDKLRESIKRINENQAIQQRFSEKQIDSIKMKEATKTALDIENQVAIIDNQIAYLERNPIKNTDLIENTSTKSLKEVEEEFDENDWDDWDDKLDNWEEKLERSLEKLEREIEKSVEKFERRIDNIEYKSDEKAPKKSNWYPRSDDYLVLAVAFNNALPEGGSLQDTGIRFGGSRTFEIGYSVETRVFKNSNFLRFKYGLSLQFNGLKPEGNRIFMVDGDQTIIEEVDFSLRKNKFRMDNLILPMHLQFGSNRKNGFNYMGNHDFKIGVGGFVGLNLRNVQNLRFRDLDGNRVRERQRGDFNTNNLLYGLSGYAGWETFSFYIQYNLNPIFRNNPVDVHNIQLGVRFDIN